MKKLGLLISVLVLVSCAPQPTPDLKATETAIAHNVLATLTAQVPTPTLTPEATDTPEPTSTPKPTSTPEATATPEEWQVYESLDGNFTLAYPSSWEIEEEGVNSVTLQPPGPELARVAFLKGGAMLYDKDDEENVRTVVILLAESYGDRPGWRGFRVMDKGVWKGSVYKGYFCEYLVYKEEFSREDQPMRSRHVEILAADSVVLFGYGRFMSEDFTAEDYETIETMLESIKVK